MSKIYSPPPISLKAFYIFDKILLVMIGKLFRRSQISELLNELKQHPIPFPLVFNLISFQFAWGVVPIKESLEHFIILKMSLKEGLSH